MSEPRTVIPLTTAVAIGLAFLLVFLLAAVPVAFFLMLFLGNLGLGLSFVACIPGGMVMSSIRPRINTTSK